MGLIVACGLQPGAVTSNVTSQPPALTEVKSTSQGVTTIHPFSTISVENLPTSTPTLYTVVLNDTLIGIARKFKVDLESLLAANPKAANGPLLVGMVLTIPSGQAPAGTATPTPVPVEVQQVNCFPNQDKTGWCLALIRNGSDSPIQNLSAQLSLSQDGSQSSLQTAFSPVDTLPPGRSVVLGFLFPDFPESKAIPAIQVLTGTYLPSSDASHPQVVMDNLFVKVNWKGSDSSVAGKLRLIDPKANASNIRLLVMAFDQNGSLIGFRRWDSGQTLNGGDILPFEFNVSALQGSIDHVELLAEAEN